MRGTLLAAAVEADGQGGLRTGTPQTLFDVHTPNASASERNVFLYSPHPDGQRFLMTTMTRTEESTATTVSLLWAFELGERTWKLGFTIGLGQRPRMRQVPAGAVDRVWAEIAEAKARFTLAADTPVISWDCPMQRGSRSGVLIRRGRTTKGCPVRWSLS